MNKKKYTRKSKTLLNIFEDGGSTSSSSSSVSSAVLGGVGSIVGNAMSQMPNLAQLNADPSVDQDINDAIYGDSSQDPIARMISDISGQSTKKAVDKLKKKDVMITADNNDDLMSAYDNLDFRNKLDKDEGLEWKTAVSTALGAPWLDFQDGGVQFSGDNLAASAQGAAQGLSVGGPWGALAGGILGGVANLVSRLGRNKRIDKINKAIDERNEYLRASFDNAVSNTATQNSLNALANYSAYGGHLNLYNNGGGIHIGPSKKGTFTAAAKKRGLGVQEFANKVLANKDNYSTAMIKKANFARNFGGRKKAEGGYIQEYDNYIPDSIISYTQESVYPIGYDDYPTKRDLIELETEYYNNYPYSKEYVKEYAKEWEESNDKIINNKDNMKINSYNKYALGGTLNPDSEYADEINEYNTGGTHEENPYEGVQVGVDPQGTPNMVEEGEVRYGGYIFSNRLAPDKSLLEEFKLPTSYKNHTFADIAEKLSKEYQEKPNDPIVKNGTLANLERLKASQEKLKMQEAERRRSRENEISAMLQQQRIMQNPDIQEQMPVDINNYDNMNGMIPQEFPNTEIMSTNIPPLEMGRQFAEGGSLYEGLPPVSKSFYNPLNSSLYQRVRNRDNNTIDNNNYDKEIQNENLQGEREGNTNNIQESNTYNSQPDNTSRVNNNSSTDNVASTSNNTNTPKSSFKSAFSKAVKEGKKTFKWNGNKYTTELAEEKKSNKSAEPKSTYKDLTFKQAFSRARAEGLRTFWWKNREYTTRGEEEDDNTWQQRLQNIKSKKESATKRVEENQEGQKVNKKANGGSINRFAEGDFLGRARDEELFTAAPLNNKILGKVPSLSTNKILEQSRTDIGNKINGYKQQTLNNNTNNNTDKGYPTWLRYAPVVGAGLGVLTDALGLTNTPDYENADLIGNTVDNLTDYDYNPIGNYVKYTPLDRNYYINKMNAQSGATRNAILNNANGNRAMANANIIAADYNAINSLGNLARAAEEYNNDLQLKTEDFNRGTNMFNRQMDIRAYNANQANNQLRLQGRLAEAEMRNNIESMASAGRNANLTNFFNSLGDIGRENFSMNMIKFDPSRYYWIDNKGVTHYRDMSNLTEKQKEAVKASARNIRNENI